MYCVLVHCSLCSLGAMVSMGQQHGLQQHTCTQDARGANLSPHATSRAQNLPDPLPSPTTRGGRGFTSVLDPNPRGVGRGPEAETGGSAAPFAACPTSALLEPPKGPRRCGHSRTLCLTSTADAR